MSKSQDFCLWTPHKAVTLYKVYHSLKSYFCPVMVCASGCTYGQKNPLRSVSLCEVLYLPCYGMCKWLHIWTEKPFTKCINHSVKSYFCPVMACASGRTYGQTEQVRICRLIHMSMACLSSCQLHMALGILGLVQSYLTCQWLVCLLVNFAWLLVFGA